MFHFYEMTYRSPIVAPSGGSADVARSGSTSEMASAEPWPERPAAKRQERDKKLHFCRDDRSRIGAHSHVSYQPLL